MTYIINARKSTGDIIMCARNTLETINDPTVEQFTVPSEYDSIFDDIMKGIKIIHRYKINTESKDLKIYCVDDMVSEDDESYNKFTLIPFSPKSNDAISDLVITVFTRDHSPRMVVTYNGPPVTDPSKNSFDIYLTDKNDINTHYQTFNCNFDQFDENSSMEFSITDIDSTKLFQNDFSFFYRRIFNTAVYVIK
jgi:hypothetical protein